MYQQHPSQTFPPLAPLQLSPLEELFWRAEEDHCGAFRVVLLLRLEGCIDAGLLARSLLFLQRRHPRLRAAFSGSSDERPFYEFHESAPPIPIEIVEYSGDEAPWREAARNLLHREFARNGPLAAVRVLRHLSQRTSYLLIAMHHCVADGLSAIMIADDLLNEYARAEEKSDVPSPPELTVMTANRARTSAPWKHRIRMVQRAVRLQRLEKNSEQTVLPAQDDVPPQSQWVHWVLSREETLRLVRRCRTEKTSLSGALVAAVYSALVAALPGEEALFKCQIPLSVRETLKSPTRAVTGEDLGCFVGIMTDFQKVSCQSSFWDVARSAHQSFETFQNGGGPSLCYNLTAVATTRSFARAAPKLLANTGKRPTLLATSYGVLNVKAAYGSLRPKACTLLVNNDNAGPSLVIEALVLGQELNIGFAADQLEPTFWSELQLAVRRCLDTASHAVAGVPAVLHA